MKGAGLGWGTEVCRKWRVWYLGLVWFLVDATQYGVLFWAPLLLDALQEGDFNGGASREDLARPSSASASQPALFWCRAPPGLPQASSHSAP